MNLGIRWPTKKNEINKRQGDKRCLLVNRRQPLFAINARLGLGTIFIRIDSEYDGWNIEISKDGIDYAYLFRFRPYDVYKKKGGRGRD